jgi:long-chain acyl-CoA synthetase
MNGTMDPPNMPTIDVCLELIPKLNYDALSTMIPRRGICICGSFLFFGYYKHKNLTKEVLGDGWVHTSN